MSNTKWLILFSIILLTACGPAPAATSTPAATDTYGFKPLPATWTPSPTDITPSLTSFQTFTPSLTYTPTKTKPPTLTPLPTLTSAEVQKMLNFMIYQNGGCKLPCWWGITPGITKFDKAMNTLSTFVTKIESDEINYRGQAAISSGIYYTVPGKQVTQGFGLLSVDGIVQDVDIYEDNTGQFPLTKLLSAYGKPEEIYIATEPASPDNIVPFGLILLYPNQGILAYFFSEYGGRINGDYVSICPQYTLPVLYLWASDSPQQSGIEMKRLLENVIYGFHESEYRTIETVGALSIDKFYATFRQKNNSSCITTEAEQWWTNPATYVPPVYDTSTPTLVDPFIETAIPMP